MDKKISKLILGTVQFGLDYGINNDQGKPSYEECKNILDLAWESGIRTLDTAEVYGSSYEVISKYIQETGNEFRIHTKFKKTPQSLKEFLSETKEKLNTRNVDVVYFHSFSDFEKTKSEGFTFLDTDKAKIGVSAYSNDEVQIAIGSNEVDIIQLPLNLLDNRRVKNNLLEVAKANGKIVATRSCFLQGLFFKELSRIPENLSPLIESLKEIKTLASEKQASIEEFAFNYPLALDEVDYMLFGVDSLAQLKSNIDSMHFKIDNELLNSIESIKIINESLLNPVNWSP